MTKKIAFSETALAHMRQATPGHTLTSARTPWTWFLLCSITLFFLALIVWGFYGSMVESVRGVGVTLLSGGVHPIVAGGSGTLSHLNIHPGSQVFTDQIVGQIYNPERLFTVKKLDSEFERLKAEAAFMEAGSKRMTKRMVDVEKDKVRRLEKLAELQAQSKIRARELGNIYASLSRSKSMSLVNYYQMLDQMVQTELSFQSTYLQAAEVSVSAENRSWQQDLTLLDLREKVEQKEEELKLAEKLYREADWLVSSFDGRVMEVLKEEGAFVQAGEKVALVGASLEEGLYLVGFVPADQGKKIRNGMSAYFSPATAPASEYGYIKCVVRNVSNAPVSAEMVVSELMNASLAQTLMGKTAVMRVELEMIPSAASRSGYAWTSGKGHPNRVVNGTLGEVLINTEYRTPASYVIPALRELLQPKAQKTSHETR
ncbi:NHLP bacteriocin system secretion protein [Desulfovibrio sp. OttesenSCG-928-G15]|nr:NHLP bacteriocin system secretion protein [Desulfovibrio sp. OttesenSCG-928-G15]